MQRSGELRCIVSNCVVYAIPVFSKNYIHVYSSLRIVSAAIVEELKISDKCIDELRKISRCVIIMKNTRYWD